MKRKILLLPLLLLLCSMTVSFAQLKGKTAFPDIYVVEEIGTVPAGAKKIDAVKMGDNMRFDCTYDKTLEAIKIKANKRGGNIIKITKHKPPSLTSNCHRIFADVYAADVLPEGFQEGDEDGPWQELIPKDADYALLCFYAPDQFDFSLLRIKVFSGDSLICRIKNNSRQIVKIYKEGLIKLWSPSAKNFEMKLNIKLGRTYFISCQPVEGSLTVMNMPVLYYVKDRQYGYEEFFNAEKDLTEGNNESKE